MKTTARTFTGPPTTATAVSRSFAQAQTEQEFSQNSMTAHRRSEKAPGVRTRGVAAPVDGGGGNETASFLAHAAGGAVWAQSFSATREIARLLDRIYGG
jgi:hypothetical protein